MPNIIHHEDIIVPKNRQRNEFDERKLEELQESIFEADEETGTPTGLLQPLVLRPDRKTLVAGECRLRSIRAELADQGRPLFHDGVALETGYVPYVTVHELSEHQLRKAELDENLHRNDLTWQEKAAAIAALHKFRVEERGEFDRSSGAGQTLTATAAEVAGTDEPTAKDRKEVAEALELDALLDNPMIAAAKDPKEAKKILKELQLAEERKAKAELYDASDSDHTLIHGSCYDLSEEHRGRYSCILTDPPYGIDAHKMKSADGHKHEYDDTYEGAFKQLLEEFAPLSFNLAAEQAHLFLFCDYKRFSDLWVAFSLAGWDVWQTPLIWDKGNIGSYGNIQFGFRQTYDCILFGNKNQKPMQIARRDIFSVPQRTDLPHPAGKPIDLYTEILMTSVMPGDHILDPFCGHGPIFPAADVVKAYATGCEINEKYYHMAVETLQGKRKDLEHKEPDF